jgi:hypothetical protein
MEVTIMSDTLHRFLPIWAIPDFLKCPVAGAMLTVEKHRSILKKCGYDVKPMKPYEYHQKIMLKLGDENNVSQKVNNFIRTQSAGQMARVAGMAERLDREKRKLNDKTRALKEMSKARKADAATIGHLEARNRELAAQVQTLQPDTATQAKNNAEKKQFEKTIQTLTADLALEQTAHQALMQKHKALQIELFSHQSELELIKKEFQSLISPRPSGTPPCPHPAENAAGSAFSDAACSETICAKSSCGQGSCSCDHCARVHCNKPLKILSSSSLSAVSQALFQPDEGVTLN